jgi:uncharacterized protein YndB with AHSA1/START domain
MGVGKRVELQAEVDVPRADLWALVATAEGLQRWLDDAQLRPGRGGEVRLTLGDAVGAGRVLALDPPQHISWSWDWVHHPLRAPSVVAFDLIDHGGRTHVTLRHAGLRSADVELHDLVWRHWFGRLVAAARTGASAPAA